MVEWILEQQQFTRAQLRKQFGLSGSTVNRKLEGWNSQRLSSGTRRTPRGAPGTTRRDGGTTVSFWTCPKSVLSSGLSTAGFCPKRCPIGQSKTPFYKTKSFARNVMHHSPYGREEFVSFVHCGQLDSYFSVWLGGACGLSHHRCPNQAISRQRASKMSRAVLIWDD